jgi:chemotaxis protein MotB
VAKRKKCPEFENHERWLVAFADMMTLLFALFVVLYAIASVNYSKIKQVTESIQVAFGVREEVPKEDGQIPSGPNMNDFIFRHIKGNTTREQILQRLIRERTQIIDTASKELAQKMAERLYGAKQFPDSANPPQDRIIHVTQDPDGIRVTLLARKFFAPSSTELDPSAKKILDGIADAIKDTKRIIRVEGHTDNLPFNKNGMSNWELSSLRAVSVAKYLIGTHNFLPGTIYAAGFADTRPLASNDTPDDRALNRRVDIKILYDKPDDYVPPDEDLGAPIPQRE